LISNIKVHGGVANEIALSGWNIWLVFLVVHSDVSTTDVM
jgi:hypothetical protein